MTNKITIDGRAISADHNPYVIAEMSANHNGNIENTYKITLQELPQDVQSIFNGY